MPFLISIERVRSCDWNGMDTVICRTKTKYMRIDGSVKTSARQALVNDFQNNGDLRAAVLSIQAAGTGLTLTVHSLFQLLFAF